MLQYYGKRFSWLIAGDEMWTAVQFSKIMWENQFTISFIQVCWTAEKKKTSCKSKVTAEIHGPKFQKEPNERRLFLFYHVSWAHKQCSNS